MKAITVNIDANYPYSSDVAYREMRQWCFHNVGVSAFDLKELGNTRTWTSTIYDELDFIHDKNRFKSGKYIRRATFTFASDSDAIVFRLKFGV